MIPIPASAIIVILYALVSTTYGQQGDPKNPVCDISIRDSDNLTLNCSRKNINTIPTGWPEEMNGVEQAGDVLITFFYNNIVNVTQIPEVPGNKIAIILKSNKIIEIQDDAFRNIHRMVYLDLSNNSISGEVLRSEIFQGPYNDGKYSKIALETLNLGHNEIHSLDRYLFQYTPNLTRLYLNNNPIEILDHVTILALSSAVKLEVLDLSKTDIDSIPLDAFRGLENLQNIDLSNNKFVTVPESLRLVGSTLKYLTFNNNPIVELNDDSFIDLTNLIELEVTENEYLEEIKRSTFTPLKSLRVLRVSHNSILRYISHNAFRGIKDKWTLKEIYMDNNGLSEVSIDLLPWNKLDVLGMTGNRWLCNCELYNIVTSQGAGTKFKPGDIPFCAAPMILSGEYITNITLSFCPSDNKLETQSGFSLSDIKPKQILWCIFGVTMVAMLGMLLGLFVNYIKTLYKRHRNQPVPYNPLSSA
ncbi:leucine-rich repeat neuronal protein 3-like [Achroia grisella]|uniref:leucine-rich repeat neuronal protein 3-like n=1 Tax=Achroia grisella TaxID=688607 RepID=UPI0027D282D6|nr:leucine-rich repeat neuronal protein 3-like [Achroia grisella]